VLLENIEAFGIDGVDSVRDLTEAQYVFMHEARRTRRDRESPETGGL